MTVPAGIAAWSNHEILEIHFRLPIVLECNAPLGIDFYPFFEGANGSTLGEQHVRDDTRGFGGCSGVDKRERHYRDAPHQPPELHDGPPRVADSSLICVLAPKIIASQRNDAMCQNR